MENITTDIFSFENLRKDGFVYVDKTDMQWRLVSKKDGRQFFIARLRCGRFERRAMPTNTRVTGVLSRSSGSTSARRIRNIDEPLFVKCERKGEAKPVR